MFISDSIYDDEFIYVIFFFFQAEDGIRDYKVTGVQTCALPISGAAARAARPRTHKREEGQHPLLSRQRRRGGGHQGKNAPERHGAGSPQRRAEPERWALALTGARTVQSPGRGDAAAGWRADRAVQPAA